MQPPDFRWHIPSTEVRPEHSAALREFLDHVEVVVTVHGYGREGFWTTLLLGGQNRALADHVASHLRPALPDYTIATDLDSIPLALRGVHPENPANLPALEAACSSSCRHGCEGAARSGRTGRARASCRRPSR